MNRSVFIDISKAICIILVVLGHFQPFFSPKWYIMLIDVIYTFHMPLFMFASGYLYALTKRNESYLSFMLKKIRRLVVPYLFCSFVIIGIKLLFQDYFYIQHPRNYYSFIEMLYKPKAGYFLWFVWALWWIFMIIPFFKTKKQRLLLLIIAFLIHFFPINVTRIFCLIETQRMLVFFVAGVIVYDLKHYFMICKQIPLNIYILLFCIFEWFYFSGYVYLPWMRFLLAFWGIGLICAFSFKLQALSSEPVLRLFSIVSTSSYFIYLFHTTFEGFAKALLIKMSLYNKEYIAHSFTFCLIVLFVVFCGVVFPILIYYFIGKKYKITRFLFGLK